MSYRDTAVALAQRSTGTFVGVVLYAGAYAASGKTSPFWSVVAMRTREELKDWYEEIAGSPTLYYYLGAFDKTQSTTVPVAETIAPPKPGDPTWGAFSVLQQQGYRWRPSPGGESLAKSRPAVSGGERGVYRRG